MGVHRCNSSIIPTDRDKLFVMQKLLGNKSDSDKTSHGLINFHVINIKSP